MFWSAFWPEFLSKEYPKLWLVFENLFWSFSLISQIVEASEKGEWLESFNRFNRLESFNQSIKRKSFRNFKKGKVAFKKITVVFVCLFMHLTLLEVDRYDTQNLPRLLLELLQFCYLTFVQRCLSRHTSIWS